MKTAIFFFDGIVLSLPPALFDEVVDSEPVLALPLARMGLLTNLDPATALDVDTSEKLSRAIYEAADVLHRVSPDVFGMYRLGWPQRVVRYTGNPRSGIGEQLLDHLARTWATTPDPNNPEDWYTHRGSQITVNPKIRQLVQFFYGQALTLSFRRNGSERSIESIYPALSMPPELLRQDRIGGPRSYNPMMHISRQTPEIEIPLDLKKVTLDDILSFKESAGADLRGYLNELKAFAKDLSASANPERVLAERSQAIEDYNSSLRSKAALNKRRALTSFGISVLGVGWTAATGDIASAVFALMSAAAGLPRNDAKKEVTSYSYLTKLQDRFG